MRGHSSESEARTTGDECLDAIVSLVSGAGIDNSLTNCYFDQSKVNFDCINRQVHQGYLVLTATEDQLERQIDNLSVPVRACNNFCFLKMSGDFNVTKINILLLWVDKTLLSLLFQLNLPQKISNHFQILMKFLLLAQNFANS